MPQKVFTRFISIHTLSRKIKSTCVWVKCLEHTEHTVCAMNTTTRRGRNICTCMQLLQEKKACSGELPAWQHMAAGIGGRDTCGPLLHEYRRLL